jgi:hypothetical protein
MKLPSLRKVFSSDFKNEYRALMDQLGILFNGALEPVYNALNKGLTFRDNFSATVAEFTVTVDSTGKPKQTTSFKLSDSQTTVEGLFVINAYGANDNTVTPASAPFVSFKRNGSSITVNNIKGLTPDIAYLIKVVALG